MRRRLPAPRAPRAGGFRHAHRQEHRQGTPGHPRRPSGRRHLHDTPPARDFAKLLPLTLELEDFHDTERVAALPRRLDTSGAPEPVRAGPGDIAYYAPWGNLALFHREGPAPSADLLVLGRLDAGPGQLGRAARITLEAAPSPAPRSPS
nr:cyclophilin-like fold protein [Streptomyces sp. N1]